MRETRPIARVKPLKKLRTTLIQGLAGLALVLLPQQGHSLTVTIDSATVMVGDTFLIDVHVVDAIPSLTSWQFDLTYDPTILQANLVTEGPFLASTGGPTVFSAGIIDNSTGLISLVTNFYAGLTPPSGSGVLATLSLTALAEGSSPITASNVFLDFSDSGFAIANGTVTVVPAPSTVSLMTIGLLVLWGLGRRRDAGAPAEEYC